MFFGVVFFIYYLPFLRKSPNYQNIWLLLASYFFYSIAECRMVPLLFGSTTLFYWMGLILRKTIQKEKTKLSSFITTLGVVIGMSVLLYFKYLDFFADSFATVLRSVGFNISWTTLNLVLPIGVSFYIFKLISYIIEIHREHIEPSIDFIEFATYVAFFPTILAGPIDRPNKFIPQLKKNRYFKYSLAIDGCRQILWGMFTKMCIADNLAIITNTVWADYDTLSASTLVVAALIYPLEIYADFDGYSNMAIGVGKLLGLKISKNFNHPLLGRTTAEYWHRWHMSLTAWILDYVFMPLSIAFMNLRKWGVIFAIMINMIIIGFWHGANWTYGLFGLYHGLLFVPLVLWNSYGKSKHLITNGKGLPRAKDFFMMIVTYILVAFGHIFFVAPSTSDAFMYLSLMMNRSFFPSSPDITIPLYLIVLCVILILLEWIMKDKEYSFELTNIKILEKRIIRWSLYTTLLVLVYVFQGEHTEFIYFQF